MRRMLLAAVLLPVAALAQSGADPDVVVTATRIPTLLERVPAGVSVIDRATIEARGYTMLSDALAALPGLRLVPSGGNGGNASLFIRGTNSNHVLVLRDGAPQNDPSDPGGLYNFGVDSLADVERIEVVRGPMSSLYGSGAIGGVVNLITRKGKGAPSGSVELAAGLPAQGRLAANISGATGRFHYALAAEAREETGFDTTPKRMTGVYTGARNPFNARSLTVNLGADLTEETEVTAFLRARRAGFRLDGFGYDANAYRGADDSLSGRLALTHHMFDGAWQTTLSVAQMQSDRRYKEPLEALDPNLTASDSRYHGKRTEFRWDNTVHLPDTGPLSAAALIFGAAHSADTARSAIDANYAGFPYQSSTRASGNTDSGNVGALATLWHRLTLTAGLRAEDSRVGGSAVTWRVGGVFALPEVGARLKAAYGTAFRAPSLYDLYGLDSGGYQGNPLLKPEHATGYELGVSVDLPGRSTLDLTYFNNRINNLIQIVYAPDYSSATSRNVDRARSEGVEASVTIRPVSWLDATASYTRTETRNLTTGQALLRRPRDVASLSARIAPLDNLTLTPELIYTSSFQDYLSDDNGLSVGIGRAHPGALLNLAASYILSDRLTLFATGRNIGNSHFEPVNGFQTPGPSILAGLRGRF
jgi:vitamin B12 transporter